MKVLRAVFAPVLAWLQKSPELYWGAAGEESSASIRCFVLDSLVSALFKGYDENNGSRPTLLEYAVNVPPDRYPWFEGRRPSETFVLEFRDKDAFDRFRSETLPAVREVSGPHTVHCGFYEAHPLRLSTICSATAEYIFRSGLKTRYPVSRDAAEFAPLREELGKYLGLDSTNQELAATFDRVVMGLLKEQFR